jgi:hypothetical protein
MFLRSSRKKDGKEHRYWSLVENKRVSGRRVVQRHVLYLGEINSSQELAWRKSIEVLEDGGAGPRTLALSGRSLRGVLPDASIVRLKLSQLRLSRPRQWGACWLALKLWGELRLDRFWAERLPASRKGTLWDQVLFVLVAYRLIAPEAEMAIGSAVVRAQRLGAFAGGGRCAGGQSQTVPLPRPAAGRTIRRCSIIWWSAGICSRLLRRAAVRLDQQLVLAQK